MELDELELKRTAILFFDILNGYYPAKDEKTTARLKPMVDNAARLMKAGREAGLPIFFARGNHRADGSTSGRVLSDSNYGRPWSGGVVSRGRPMVVDGEQSSRVIPELEPRADDYDIPKHRWSAFYQTYLDLALRTRGIDTVIISGASTFVGVASTVYAGRDMDYSFIVARDACSAPDRQVHEAMMDVVFPRMARVRTTDQVLAMIQEAKRKSQ